MPVMQKKLKLSRPLTPIITSSFWKCIPTIPFPSWPLTRQVKVLVPIRYPSKLSREFPDRQLIWNLAKSQWILSRSAGILQSSQMAKFLATSWLTKQQSKTKVSCVLAFIVHCVTQKKGRDKPKKNGWWPFFYYFFYSRYRENNFYCCNKWMIRYLLYSCKREFYLCFKNAPNLFYSKLASKCHGNRSDMTYWTTTKQKSLFFLFKISLGFLP